MTGLSRERIVIVGGGQAAAQVADQLVRLHHPADILLLTEEPVPPYQRPPLSKSYLTGRQSIGSLAYRWPDFWAKHDIDVRVMHHVSEIDRNNARIVSETGETIAYDRLAIATGAVARRMDIPGAESSRVCYLRTIADADRLRSRLVACQRVVIIGGGFIGLEVAAVLISLGRQATVLHSQKRVIPRTVGPALSDFYHAEHNNRGVVIHTGVDVIAIEDGPSQARILCNDGTAHSADLVLVGIGAEPNIGLARQAGLVCDNGIVVDEFTRTSDTAIVAAGDCTNHPNALIGRRLRLETVHNAVEQGRAAGSALAGVPAAYMQTPWVWSDQYDLRLQIVGLHDNDDLCLLRGSLDRRSFSYWYFRDDRLVAVHAVNRPSDFGLARRILNENRPMTPDQIGDPSVVLSGPPAPLSFDIAWRTRATAQAPVLAWPAQA